MQLSHRLPCSRLSVIVIIESWVAVVVGRVDGLFLEARYFLDNSIIRFSARLGRTTTSLFIINLFTSWTSNLYLLHRRLKLHKCWLGAVDLLPLHIGRYSAWRIIISIDNGTALFILSTAIVGNDLYDNLLFNVVLASHRGKKAFTFLFRRHYKLFTKFVIIIFIDDYFDDGVLWWAYVWAGSRTVHLRLCLRNLEIDLISESYFMFLLPFGDGNAPPIFSHHKWAIFA